MSSTVDPAAGAEFGLRRIHQIAVTVQDVERATAFYRDALGMPLLFRAPAGLSFFDCGGVRLMLSTAESPGFDHPGSVIYYRVNDIAATYESLKKRGVEFIDQPHLIAKLEHHDVWIAAFRDQEENTLALISEVERAD